MTSLDMADRCRVVFFVGAMVLGRCGTWRLCHDVDAPSHTNEMGAKEIGDE